MENYSEEVQDDVGPAQRLREVLSEQVQPINIDPQQLYRRAVSEYHRHRKGILKLGALGLSSLSLGFTAGALAFSHRR